MTTAIVVTLPLRLVSVANAREHWAAKHRRTAEHRRVARMALATRLAGLRAGRTSLVVTITRVGKRRLDTDNLASAGKAVRDGIADALGIDDGDDRVQWRYEQRIGASYAVEIRIERRTTEAA